MLPIASLLYSLSTEVGYDVFLHIRMYIYTILYQRAITNEIKHFTNQAWRLSQKNLPYYYEDIPRLSLNPNPSFQIINFIRYGFKNKSPPACIDRTFPPKYYIAGILGVCRVNYEEIKGISHYTVFFSVSYDHLIQICRWYHWKIPPLQQNTIPNKKKMINLLMKYETP